MKQVGEVSGDQPGTGKEASPGHGQLPEGGSDKPWGHDPPKDDRQDKELTSDFSGLSQSCFQPPGV